MHRTSIVQPIRDLAGHKSLWPALALALIFFVSACSSDDPTPTTEPTVVPTTPPTVASVPSSTPVTEIEPSGGLQEPEQEWIVRTDNEEVDAILATPDLGPGTRRFAMVLTDKSAGIVAFPVVQVASYRYPDGEDSLDNREGPIETSRARYFPFPYGTRGIHVTELTFDEIGTWGVEARIPRPDGSVATVEVITEVHERTMSVDVGEIPPLSVSRTLEDVYHVSELTTGSSRDESLYQISVADALQNGKPTVIVFASPAFCTNAVCGPQVEVLGNLSRSYPGQANYVHIDLFTNPQEIQGDLSRAMPTPLLSEWGLVSQEWTFVMGGDGKVIGRFENFVPQEELEPVLVSIFDAEGVQPETGPTPVPPTATPELPTFGEVVPEPTSEPDDSASDAATGPQFQITGATLWREVYDKFNETEQQCIRNELGDEQMAFVLGQRVAAEGEPGEWENSLFECLETETVRAMFESTTLGALGDQLSEAGVTCVKELIAGSDVKAVIAGELPDADPENIAVAGKYFAGMIACSLADQVGSSEASNAGEQCIADLFESTDFAQVYIGGRPDATPEESSQFQGFMGELLTCFSEITLPEPQ